MWISRTHYEHLFAALSAARERIVQLERLDAAHTASIEWMRLHVNRLEVERAILTQERLKVLYPTPTILREADAPPPENAGQTILDKPVSRDLPPDSIPLTQLLGSLLEDVGDDMAGRLGVSNANPEGVLTTR